MNRTVTSILANLLIILLLISCNGEKKTDISSLTDTPADGTPKVLIKGAFFNGANGLYFDEEDRLYVASVVGRFIGVVDTETGAIIDTLGQAEGIEGPDDLAFGPDGSLYHTSILTGEVGRRKPDGTVSQQLVSAGVNPITFSDDGRLFVALDFQGDGLYELDPALELPPRLIIKELGWLNGMDFGPDGYLYGPIWSKGQIVKIDVDKATVEVIVDDLVTPAAVKFDSKGRLHTVDHSTGIVYQIDIKDGSKREIGHGFEGADNIAFNSKDELYLSHAQDGSVYQINMDGTSRVVIRPSLCNAGDIEIIDGELIASDLLSMKTFDRTTGKQTNVLRHIIGRPGMIGPFTIDSEGDEIVLTSWFSNEVQVWNTVSGSETSIHHDYIVPLNAILDGGSLVVAELGLTPGAAKVTRAIGTHREVLIDGSKGLIVPSGLAAIDGKIYVADFFKGVVFQLTEDDKLLAEPIVVVSDLKQPEGLQIGPDGQLIIVETGADQIISFDFVSGQQTELAKDIPLGLQPPAGMPPTWKMSDVHFDREGNLYVPSDVENVVYKIHGTL